MLHIFLFSSNTDHVTLLGEIQQYIEKKNTDSFLVARKKAGLDAAAISFTALLWTTSRWSEPLSPQPHPRDYWRNNSNENTHQTVDFAICIPTANDVNRTITKWIFFSKLNNPREEWIGALGLLRWWRHHISFPHLQTRTSVTGMR